MFLFRHDKLFQKILSRGHLIIFTNLTVWSWSSFCKTTS